MVKNKEKTNTMKRLASGDPGDEPIAKRLRQSTRTSFGVMLQSLINNPGFRHIVEKIFQNIDKHYLLKFRLVNSSWKQILDRPMFWYRNLISIEITSLYPPARGYVWVPQILQKLNPDDYEEQKKHALRMIKLLILETRRKENLELMKKMDEEIHSIEQMNLNNFSLNCKKLRAIEKNTRVIKNQIRQTEKITQLMELYGIFLQ